MAADIATYHEVIDSLVDGEVLIIDVRDPNEIAETGAIPTSINIPREINFSLIDSLNLNYA
jgi:rhodanese-related sulfurtransferase